MIAYVIYEETGKRRVKMGTMLAQDEAHALKQARSWWRTVKKFHIVPAGKIQVAAPKRKK